jgi:hypothetical protein
MKWPKVCGMGYQYRPSHELAQLPPIGIIAVVGDVPGVSEESLACLTRVGTGRNRIGDCGTSRAEAFARSDPLMEASQLVSAATLIDLTQYYCTADRCPSVIGNAIVYGDWGAHVTATYIKTLSPAIIDGVRQAIDCTNAMTAPSSRDGLPCSR